MIDAIADVAQRSKKYLAPIVRFERLAIEDHAASLSTGRYMAKDLDFAYITPPFSKDEVVKKAKTFLDDNIRKVQLGQMPKDSADRYLEQYTAWLNGQELPTEGTAIKGWSMLSPAQQAMLIDRKILTVEMLAQANDAGLGLIGMGGVAMRQMAQNWLAQANDKGPLTIQMTELQQQNEILKGSVETLTQQVAALRAVAKIETSVPVVEKTTISEADIFDVEPLQRKKR